MTCERCLELQERVAWLESELGLQQETEDYRRLRNFLRGTTEGRKAHCRAATSVVAALYRAKGRPVGRLQLLEMCPSPNGDVERQAKTIDVWICFAARPWDATPSKRSGAAVTG